MKKADFQPASTDQYFPGHQIELLAPDGQPPDIPLGGSTGLLALRRFRHLRLAAKDAPNENGIRLPYQSHLAAENQI